MQDTGFVLTQLGRRTGLFFPLLCYLVLRNLTGFHLATECSLYTPAPTSRWASSKRRLSGVFVVIFFLRHCISRDGFRIQGPMRKERACMG
ncbi:hypothetical protein P153DRAFT_12354 [Dothidotthia symphoricarpi CBS 119687]|uniref:Uncharacterized protein n=1 Tax=Dothidotthia symphoricarpi CBS 119687 TaxID=1392245 RepID=A0A6A6AUP6_9PLEO|nr:uncharacterized protein P153DRAFT_12354 [Dothidotthia symphoricarpi CBS 119687]KAF2134908.1 hypothetical protein P153DRAFT_12354 [Dothidotthia symphoricarpi CBS 119687]